MFVYYNFDNFRLGINIPNVCNNKILDELQILNFSMSSFVSAQDGENSEIFTLKQVHGTEIVFIESGKIFYKDSSVDFSYSLREKFQADAIICLDKNVKIGIRSADCAPIMFYGKELVGGIHAGWRGLKSGIIQNVINTAISKYNFKPENGIYFILPCIHSCCYEVGQEFLEWAKDFCLVRNGKVYFDIPKFVLSKLKEFDVSEENIYYSPLCTSCYSNVLPSYRASNTEERLESFIELT